MKLRTELPEGGTCFFKDGPSDHVHDAAVAHALMQAMSYAYNTDPDVIDFIEKRADELMREWGFEQEKEG